MALNGALERKLIEYVEENTGRLVELIGDLVRIPSENTPPTGEEGRCQEYLAGVLGRAGWEPVLYEPDQAPGLREHPLFWPGRDYRGRPNLGARRAGAGGGRSLVLSGHADTVPRGSEAWSRDPFGGAVEGNRLYGRGANDMKGGVGTNLFVAEAIQRLGLRLGGDLVFESVVDEEFGGVNGTLAGRLMGFNADAAVISEPSSLRVCPAQRGGRTAHITFKASGGILPEGRLSEGVVEQLTRFLAGVPRFAAERRRKVAVHEMYDGLADPVPVSITKVFSGGWGAREPITVPETCQVEMYWQLMPGEEQDAVEREFFAWLDGLFPARPAVEFPIRWMPGWAMERSEPLVEELAACAAKVLGREPPIQGIEGPCDMYVFHQAFGIPVVLWGARGGNTHGSDEWLDLESAVSAAKALLLFVCRWCGAAE
jgi:acetylornithine deacetylase